MTLDPRLPLASPALEFLADFVSRLDVGELQDVMNRAIIMAGDRFGYRDADSFQGVMSDLMSYGVEPDEPEEETEAPEKPPGIERGVIGNLPVLGARTAVPPRPTPTPPRKPAG